MRHPQAAPGSSSIRRGCSVASRIGGRLSGGGDASRAGAAQVALTYMTAGARWLPTTISSSAGAELGRAVAGRPGQPGDRRGLERCRPLTLSTAVPATATQLPKLQLEDRNAGALHSHTAAPHRGRTATAAGR